MKDCVPADGGDRFFDTETVGRFTDESTAQLKWAGEAGRKRLTERFVGSWARSFVGLCGRPVSGTYLWRGHR